MTICIVLVACIFNIVSILLVTRYLYLRFANEQREALSAQQREQQQQAGGGDPEAPDEAGAQCLARYTPVLVLQPDSKVLISVPLSPWPLWFSAHKAPTQAFPPLPAVLLCGSDVMIIFHAACLRRVASCAFPSTHSPNVPCCTPQEGCHAHRWHARTRSQTR